MELKQLSADDQARYEAEWRERALKNKNSELAAAREEGRKEGRIIGQIQLLQEFSKHPVIDKDDLLQYDLPTLQTMLQQLKAELK